MATVTDGHCVSVAAAANPSSGAAGDVSSGNAQAGYVKRNKTTKMKSKTNCCQVGGHQGRCKLIDGYFRTIGADCLVFAPPYVFRCCGCWEMFAKGADKFCPALHSCCAASVIIIWKFVRVLKKWYPHPQFKEKHIQRYTGIYIYIKYLPTHAMTTFYCFPAAPNSHRTCILMTGQGVKLLQALSTGQGS